MSYVQRDNISYFTGLWWQKVFWYCMTFKFCDIDITCIQVNISIWVAAFLSLPSFLLLKLRYMHRGHHMMYGTGMRQNVALCLTAQLKMSNWTLCSFVVAVNVLVCLYTVVQIVLSIMSVASGTPPSKNYSFASFGCDQVYTSTLLPVSSISKPSMLVQVISTSWISRKYRTYLHSGIAPG